MNDTAQLGALPTWDLADLYPGRESPELKGDLEAAVQDADAFAGRYKDQVAGLEGAVLGAALAEYERQQERLGRIMSYAHLVYAGNVTDRDRHVVL